MSAARLRANAAGRKVDAIVVPFGTAHRVRACAPYCWVAEQLERFALIGDRWVCIHVGESLDDAAGWLSRVELRGVPPALAEMQAAAERPWRALRAWAHLALLERGVAVNDT